MSGALSMYGTLKQEGGSSSSTRELVSGNTATKKLTRGISRATENDEIVTHVRQHGFGSIAQEFTFSLPDLSIYPDDFRQYLEKDLIEGGCLTSLEAAGRLNWWCTGKNRVLWPLATTGDGNCLLHAASLGMWGFQDRELALRKLVYEALLTGEYRDALFRRWKWRQMALNADAGLSYTDEEWHSEWEAIVNMANRHPRNQMSTSYQSLEEIHIFTLAHVLQRPIIVVAETMLKDSKGAAFAPISFGGIYLPLEINPQLCHHTPLLLAYHSAHFSPLVTVDSRSDPSECNNEGYSIPLVDPDTTQLYPVLFAIDPGSEWDWNSSQHLLPCEQATMASLIKQYLDYEYQDFAPDEVDRLSESDAAKSKPAKQLIEVAKQFGSMGKSVGKKIMLLGKRSKNPLALNSEGYGDTLLCVRIRSKRHKYVDQMLQNYLDGASTRFIKDHPSSNSNIEMNYGAGKSKFYAVSDSNSYASVKNLPQSSYTKDCTMYLTSSTFFKDQLPEKPKIESCSNNETIKHCRTQDCKYFGSKEHNYYCSQCWAEKEHRRP